MKSIQSEVIAGMRVSLSFLFYKVMQTVICLSIASFITGCYGHYGSYGFQSTSFPVRAGELLERAAILGMNVTVRKKSNEPNQPDTDATVIREYEKNGLNCKDVITHYFFNQSNDGIILTICYLDGMYPGWFMDTDYSNKQAASEKQPTYPEQHTNTTYPQTLSQQTPPILFPANLAPTFPPWINPLINQAQMGYGYSTLPPPIWMRPGFGQMPQIYGGFQFY